MCSTFAFFVCMVKVITCEKERDINYYGTNRKIANSWKNSFTNNMLKKGSLIISEKNGIENTLNIKSGVIITLNYFNPFDILAIEEIFRVAEI